MNIDTLSNDARSLGQGLSRRRAFYDQLREMPHIKVISGPSKGEGTFVGMSPFRVGKGFNNQFSVADGAVAPFHFSISRNAIGSYVLTTTEPTLSPVYLRSWGRYRAASSLTLKDGMVLRLGRQGPRIKYRYLGDAQDVSRVSKLLGSNRQAAELLPESQVISRLDQMVTGPRLSDAERHYVRQASQYLGVVASYRQWLVALGVLGFLLAGLTMFFKITQDQTRTELTRAREQLKTRWVQQEALSNTAQPAAGEQKSEEDKASLLLANDRTARGILNVMNSFGIQNPHISYQFVSAVKVEIDKEKERILRDSDFEGFLDRYRRYHARIEDIFRKEYQLPTPLANVAWIESDYFIDAESEQSELGMWQFSVATAIKYELITPKGEDFRQDFERSTRAAGRYLSDLLAQFGMENFMVALAAYNWGPDNVLGIYRTYKLWPAAQRDFPFMMGLRGDRGATALPDETLQYVPRFFATCLIGSDMSFYFGK